MITRIRLIFNSVKLFLVGKSLDPLDSQVFHNVSLVAFFALIGLGSDGLSSSVYGPAEAFHVLHQYPYLGIFVGLASVFTIFVISQSYSQIIEKFPFGGGGYAVASKLLSPTMGMISGCALLVDYVLTITISIASGADAIFSFLPPAWHDHKIWIGIIGIFVLIILNLRGAKETVKPLVPIFLIFILTHVFVIGYTMLNHVAGFTHITTETHRQVSLATSNLGLFGMLFLLLKAYSMGAGTYTGIEAISNGLGVLREPRVKTAKRTMLYMMVALSFMVLGLMLCYIFLDLTPEFGKTYNALLLENITSHWPATLGSSFVLITLISEAAILFVAAQTGFFDGPRVLANMALDRWFPSKFAMLSDRLVTQKGVLMMGVAAIITLILTKGSVTFLIVLYSINVFVTFVLSQLGMTRHWITKRASEPEWFRKLLINGIGLILCIGILISMVILKFHDGGWLTLVITGSLVLLMLLIKRHYLHTAKRLRKLDTIMSNLKSEAFLPHNNKLVVAPTERRTAVLLVNGFTGLGLHTLKNIHHAFPQIFDDFVFVQIGLIDAGVFKGADDVGRMQKRAGAETQKYVEIMQSYGYNAEGISKFGVDIIAEILALTPGILEKHPRAIFFGGQLVFPQDSLFTRWLHNSIVFTVQEKLYVQGIPFMIIPVKV